MRGRIVAPWNEQLPDRLHHPQIKSEERRLPGDPQPHATAVMEWQLFAHFAKYA